LDRNGFCYGLWFFIFLPAGEVKTLHNSS
jgi:hypothetical protein